MATGLATPAPSIVAGASADAPTGAPILLVDSLERLPVHLNTVLIQIGKIFRHQSHSEQKFLSRQKAQAHEGMMKASRDFHDALDEIEVEILNARAVLERDLNEIRARRSERESLARHLLDGKPIPDQSEDIMMQDVSTDPTIKIQTPEEGQASMQAMRDAIMTNGDQQIQSKVQTPQELKGLGLDNDLFDQDMTDDFGPVGQDSSFDLFNSVPGEDFVTGFQMGEDHSSAVIPPNAITPNAVAAAINVDGGLLMGAFQDTAAPVDSEAAKAFGDIDFGTIDHSQDDTHVTHNPFGDHNNDGFDDFFNS